jgi:hypothetical protein
MEEGSGFEPEWPLDPTVFKTAALNRSATLPYYMVATGGVEPPLVPYQSTALTVRRRGCGVGVWNRTTFFCL